MQHSKHPNWGPKENTSTNTDKQTNDANANYDWVLSEINSSADDLVYSHQLTRALRSGKQKRVAVYWLQHVQDIAYG